MVYKSGEIDLLFFTCNVIKLNKNRLINRNLSRWYLGSPFGRAKVAPAGQQNGVRQLTAYRFDYSIRC